MLEEWLAALGKKYKINIVVTKGDNHFVSKTYDITDPMGNGLGFRVSANDQGVPSVFDTAVFPFEHFNIAEYVTSEDILAAAEHCLTGRLRTRKDFLGRYRLDFDLSTFKGYSKPARKSMGRQTYRPYSLREAVTPSNKDVPDDNKKDV